MEPHCMTSSRVGCEAETRFQDDGLYLGGIVDPCLPTDVIVGRSRPPCPISFLAHWFGSSKGSGYRLDTIYDTIAARSMVQKWSIVLVPLVLTAYRLATSHRQNEPPKSLQSRGLQTNRPHPSSNSKVAAPGTVILIAKSHSTGLYLRLHDESTSRAANRSW